MTPTQHSEGHSRAAWYRTVWRWHSYAGLLVAPVLIILAVTGGLYLFDHEFGRWWNRSIAIVTPGTQTLPLATQEAAVTAAFPDTIIQRTALPRTADEAARWLVKRPGGKPQEVYLNPYDGRITGVVDPSTQPMALIRDLHGNLLSGDVGSYVVELTACWTLIMLVTGLFLWWPRTWKLKGVFVLRLKASGRRFWRDVHAIPSMINAVLVIFLILTGLPWSVFWGQHFARLGEIIPFIAPSPNFLAHPPQTLPNIPQSPHAQHTTQDLEATRLPWIIRQIPKPRGYGPTAISIEQVEKFLPLLGRQRYGGGVRIFYPSAAGDVFTISYVPQQSQGQRTLYIDPVDGRLLGDIGWTDYSPAAKIIEWGTMTHMGLQYGLANQLAGLTVCIGIVATATAGIILWWRRRPAGTLATPQNKPHGRLPPVIVYMLVVMAILFPLVGASLIFIWGGEKIRAKIAL